MFTLKRKQSLFLRDDTAFCTSLFIDASVRIPTAFKSPLNLSNKKLLTSSISSRVKFSISLIFNEIAVLKDFSINYEGDYTILESKDDDIQVWFRYDEEFDQKKEKRMYAKHCGLS